MTSQDMMNDMNSLDTSTNLNHNFCLPGPNFYQP